MNGFQLAPIDLSVDLRGGDGGVAEHLLNDAEVGSARQQMGGEGMTELVGMNRLLDPGALGIITDQLPDTCRSEGMSPHGEEDRSAGTRREEFGAGRGEIHLQGLERRPVGRLEAEGDVGGGGREPEGPDGAAAAVRRGSVFFFFRSF